MLQQLEKYVAVSGGFDPVHKGHIEMIKDAANYGKVVVLLNSDNWLIRKKGKSFIDEEQRSYIMNSIKEVHTVILMNDVDDTALDGLKQMKKLFSTSELYFANGGDRKEKNVPEVEYCLSNNINLLWNVGGKKSESSSHLLSNWVGDNCKRDWGSWTVLKDYKAVKVKELCVLPNKELSFQRHQYRAEHWYIVKGTAYVYINDEGVILNTYETIDIPQGTWHQLCNYSDVDPLFVLEVQQGAKCVEEDIERSTPPMSNWRNFR